MIDIKKRTVWLSASGALMLGLLVSGCGPAEVTETSATTTSTAPAGTAPHQHAEGEDSAAMAMLAAWFPGAAMTRKLFPMNDEAMAHLGEEAGLKFAGNEGSWGVYEAVKDGQRVGLAVAAHATPPGGKEMHVNFAVDKKFVVTRAEVP